MADRRGRRLTTRSRDKVVNYSWAGFQNELVRIPIGTKVLLGSFVLEGTFDETIVRTRGIMNIVADGAVVVETQLGAWGMIRISDTAFAIGVTAIPSPVFDAGDDGWLAWVPFAQRSSLTVGAGPQGMSYVIDSKAQRIIRAGTRIAVVIENSGAVGGIDVTVQLRALARFRS